MPTGFFDLPRELRDQIYDHLWASMPHVLMPYSSRLLLRAYFDVAPGSIDGFSILPRGISASRSLLHEALSAFHCKGAVQVDGYLGILKPTCGGRESLEPHSSEDACAEFKISPPALTPLVVRELHVEAVTTSDLFHRVGLLSYKTAIDPEDAIVLRHLVDSHARIGAPKSWKIRINFLSTLDLQHIIDFGALYDMGRISHNLTSVELEIVLKTTWPSTLLRLRLGPALSTEMETLGQNVFPNFKATAKEVHEEVDEDDSEVKWLFSFTKAED
jgi:hypothetical protein